MTRLIPYEAFDGIPTFTDSFIMGLYNQMYQEGTADRVFIDGSVLNAEGFLNMAKFGSMKLFVIYGEDNSENSPDGVFWLNNFQAMSAQLHFCFFKKSWGRKALEHSKYCVNASVNMKNALGEPMFDLIHGSTPADNVLALRLVKLSGMTILGEMPCGVWNHKKQESVPAIISYITRG